MSNIQFILTIAVCAAATMLTRFLPFLVFGSRGGKVPEVVEYLGHVLPAAIFGMLIVYCLKGVSLTSGSHGIPEAIAIGVTVALHTPGMAQGRGLSFYLPAYDNGYTGDLFPRETVGHTGFTGTSFALDPTSGLYVIFLTNRICPSRDSLEIYRVRRLLHNAVYAAASR